MKSGHKALVGGLLALLLAVPAAFAQHKNGKPKVKYDLAAEVKVKGTIEEITEYECPVSGGLGAHIVLKTGSGTEHVHIALAKFLKEYEMKFEKGQEIEVLGARVKVGEQDALLVRQITRGQDTFTFRDKQGKPLW